MGLKKFNEFVQLDELSKETLGRYIMHATQSYADNQEKRNKHREDAQIVGRMDHNASAPVRKAVSSTVDTLHAAANKHDDKRYKRGHGIQRAVKRLTAEGIEAVTEEEIAEIFENYEQLDELSKQTLGNYLKKAANNGMIDAQASGGDYSKSAEEMLRRKKHLDKAVKRLRGIRNATDKLVKEGADALTFEELELLGENFELLSELSKNTLKSYVKKASRSLHDSGWEKGKAYGRGASNGEIKPMIRQSNKRKAGIDKAVDKLSEEDLDEVWKNNGHTTITKVGENTLHIETMGKHHEVSKSPKRPFSDWVVHDKQTGEKKRFNNISDTIKHLSAEGHRDLHPKHFNPIY